jgi:Tfp pilus assembly protein PilO
MKPMLLVVLIGVALAGLFGYHVIYAPQQEQVRLIEAQRAQELANQQAQGEVAALLLEIERYRRQLAPEPDASWLAREVVAIGQAAGVQLNTISQQAPQQVQSDPSFIRLSVGLEFSATYHQVGTFLDHIERSDYFIRAEQLQVNSESSGGPATVGMTLTTFYLPPLAQGPAG